MAIKDGRINLDAQRKIEEGWIELFNNNFDTTKMLLDSLPKRQSVARMIENVQSKGDRTGWTLSDYRKKDPKALKNNPSLFTQLLELEKNK